MSAAIFNDQKTLAGTKLGISTAKAIALTIMGLGLGAMNIYHMGNAITSKLLTPDSSILLFAMLYFIASCIAFIEVPLTEEVVSQKAKHGGKSTASILGYKLMLTIVACMAVAGGVYSITTDAEKVDSRRTAHDTKNSSFEDLKQGLISDRNAARRQALSFDTDSQRQIETSRANSDYYRALAKLKNQQAGHQVSRPTSAVDTGSLWHWFWAIGFSLLCSIGVIVITAYLAKYHKPLTEIPRVFFRTKENQEWKMDDDDVSVLRAHVDLTGGSSTKAARATIGRPSDVDNATPAGVQNGSDEKPPALGTTRVSGENDVSGRTLNQNTDGMQNGTLSSERYGDLKREILAGKLPPTVRAIKAWLRANNIGTTDKTRSGITDKILVTMKDDGLLILNPEQGKTNKIVAKYVLNPDYQSEQGEGAKTEQGEHPDDAYWEDIIARLDRGEPVESVRGDDGSGKKPKGWYEYEMRQLKKAMESSGSKKVDGGTITWSGPMSAFVPDEIPVADVSGSQKFRHKPVPKWISQATEFEHNNISVFALEIMLTEADEGVYRLAILSPDQSYCLYEMEAEDNTQALETINEKGSKFNQALKAYRRIEKAEQGS